MGQPLKECARTAGRVEAYIQDNLFDPAGIMYSGIDSHTGRPFERDFITPIKVPRRARFDPWAYWTYEDSILASGLYIDGLILQHELTGDSSCLDRAAERWGIVKNVYSCSQVHGIGTFLRPYGGYQRMHQFMEPLGTDQASPLFNGLYRYLKHADERTAADITRVMLQTLEWYAAQNFEYFYYKCFLHSYDPHQAPRLGWDPSQHMNSYFLPACAWAANVAGDQKWQEVLHERLPLFASGHYNVCPAFCWGSDLTNLADIMGRRFGEFFTRDVLEGGSERCQQMLAQYGEPGTVKRVCPESAEPDFEPHVETDFDPDNWSTNLGFAYFHPRHGGRARPRHEIDFLIALASLGYEREQTAAQAMELLSHRTRVPEDFTAFLSTDYDKLPETVHLYARSVGVYMVQWWRDYWLLRAAVQGG